MIIVTGHVRLRPRDMERVRPHMRTVLEANRKEDGCLLFAFGEDVLEPGLIRVVERWRDADALAAHGAQPHVIAWRQALKEIGVLERDLIAHDAENGRPV